MFPKLVKNSNKRINNLPTTISANHKLPSKTNRKEKKYLQQNTSKYNSIA